MHSSCALHWVALVCIGVHWCALVCIGVHCMYWFALDCTGLHWSALVCIVCILSAFQLCIALVRGMREE